MWVRNKKKRAVFTTDALISVGLVLISVDPGLISVVWI